MCEDMLIGRESAIQVVTEAEETRRKVKEFREKPDNLAKKSRSRTGREVLGVVGLSVSEQSPPEWSSSPQKMREEDRGVVQDLYSMLTFKLFQSAHQRC